MLPIVAGAAGMAGRAVLQGVGKEIAGQGLEMAKDAFKNDKPEDAQANSALNNLPKSPISY
ncbi:MULTISPECIES: hypothetical protein [Erwinia]|uniref:hypothetical protein n=1 Tax=Erwinia TaxID=551 RepID=UPI00054CF2A5|nr:MULTISPECIES: hypothetical protein [Erwinia]